MRSSNVRTSFWFAIISGLLLVLAACSPQQETPPESRMHQLDIVDKEGRYYGSMEMTPLGGARVYDAKGAVIGEVMPVQYASDSRAF